MAAVYHDQSGIRPSATHGPARNRGDNRLHQPTFLTHPVTSNTRWRALAVLAVPGLIIGALAPLRPAHGQDLASGAGTPALRRDLASPSTLAPFKAGNTFFEMDATGALGVRDGERGQRRVLLAASTFSIVAPSPNGRYVAYEAGPAAAG